MQSTDPPQLTPEQQLQWQPHQQMQPHPWSQPSQNGCTASLTPDNILVVSTPGQQPSWHPPQVQHQSWLQGKDKGDLEMSTNYNHGEESNEEWQLNIRKRRRRSDGNQLNTNLPTLKEKTIPLQNKFAPLMNDIQVQNEAEGKESHFSIPPIFIPGITNVPKLIEILKQKVNQEDFTYKMYNNEIKLMPRTVDAFRLIIKLLDEKKAAYHTYQLKQDRAFRVVLRYLHPTIDKDEVVRELKTLGHTVRNLHNVRHRLTKRPLSLFFVDLEPSPNNKDIYKIEKLVNAIIKFEPPYKKKTAVQCHRCQEYGHTRSYCRETPKCVKCGEEHFTEDCKKDRNAPAICALCSDNHPANYKGCPEYQRYMKSRIQYRKSTFQNPILNPKEKQIVPNASDFPPLPIHSLQNKTSNPNSQSVRKHEQPHDNAIYYPNPKPVWNTRNYSNHGTTNDQEDLSQVLDKAFQRFENILKQQSVQINTLLNLITTLISKMH